MSERKWSETAVGLEEGVVCPLVVDDIKAVFESSFRFTYLLFVVTWTMYYVNEIFRMVLISPVAEKV